MIMPRLSQFIIFFALSIGFSLATDYDWVAPAPGDVRSPCPLVNALANHGYISHSGKNISVDEIVTAIDAALNLATDAQDFFRQPAEAMLTVSSTGNANTFNLNDLDVHNLIEHDGSLSRADIVSGDNESFNKTIFDETKSYWTTDSISLQQAAQALAGRQKSAKVSNPKYDLDMAQLTNALGQTAVYLGVFGNFQDGSATRAYVEYLFEKERFPTELGWVRRGDDDKITAVGIQSLTVAVSVNYYTVQLDSCNKSETL